MIVLGIDPGLAGGIAVVEDNQVLAAIDIPTHGEKAMRFSNAPSATRSDYVEQIDRFKEHQGKRTERKARNIKTHTCTCSECGKKFMASRDDVKTCSDRCRMARSRRLK